MSGVRTGRLTLFAMLLVLCMPAGLLMGGQQPVTHVDVWLRNEAGDRIKPSDNAAEPYSPRKTCGACHRYDTITKGYHFQMGSAGEKAARRPSHLPAGIFPGEIRPAPYQGVGVYDWIADNTSHHPGGGPLEEIKTRDAGGNLFTTSLIEAERLEAGKAKPDFSSRFTPDKRSRFRESGAIEADCLMCHMTGYKMDRRNAQVAARNYRWAATAGSGLGEVRGRIFTAGMQGGSWEFSRRPSVRYHWQGGRFTPEGKLSGSAIKTSVPSESCLMCHGTAQAFHTGTLHRAASDVHVKEGFGCVDCHGLASAVPGGRLSHAIGRNASPGDKGKTGMSTCRSCHILGLYRPERTGLPARAPDPGIVHEEKFAGASFHLRLLDCTACHITAMPAKGAYLFDASTGNASWYASDTMSILKDREDAAKTARESWRPWLEILDLKRGRGERYVPVNLHSAQWFGERGPKGSIQPLDRGSVAKAYENSRPLSKVRVRDAAGAVVQAETAASARDIEKMLLSLRALGVKRPVFVSDKVYELKKGHVASSEEHPGNTLSLPISHGVSPVGKKQTLGANGCTDCHNEKAAFFTKMKVKNIGGFLKESYPAPKEPNAYPQMLDWGFEEVPSHE